jgi:exonuclease VII large subunit
MQMQVLKNLYGELFVLMLQNIEDQMNREAAELADGTTGLEQSIHDLMQSIDTQMRDFRAHVAELRHSGQHNVRFEDELHQFDEQLREGLTAMQGRVAARRQHVQDEVNAIREKLKLVQRKRTGTRGYKAGHFGQKHFSSQV